MRMTVAVRRGRKAVIRTILGAMVLIRCVCVMMTQVGACGLVVGSASFLIVSDGWWIYLWELPDGVAGIHLLVEHRSVADGAPNRFGEPVWPDRRLTPGATMTLDRSEMCEIGYAARVRDVPSNVWNEAFRRYGLFWGHKREFEIDHLIPLSLAGGNDINNLWPQSRMTEPWNADVKDTLEDVLHREVCTGRVPLEGAQAAIRSDWVAAYRKYVGNEPRRFVPRSGIARDPW